MRENSTSMSVPAQSVHFARRSNSDNSITSKQGSEGSDLSDGLGYASTGTRASTQTHDRNGTRHDTRSSTGTRSSNGSAGSFLRASLSRSFSTISNLVGRTPFAAKPAVINGFCLTPEADTILLSDRLIAPFSLPADVVRWRPDESLKVVQYSNGERERRIHCNTVLSDDEKDMLSSLQALAKAEKQAFYPTVSSMATRLLTTARGDIPKALNKMKFTQSWRETYFENGPITEADVANDLAHGIVYFCGRDDALRPALVLRLSRIPDRWYADNDFDRFVKLLIFCMEYMLKFMLLGGKVETINVIVDVHGLSPSRVPLNALTEVQKILSANYAVRVHRIYVVRVPMSVMMISGLVKRLLSERQRAKIILVKDAAVEMRENFSPQQLEEDLGGTRKSITCFFPFPLLPGPFHTAVNAADESPEEPIPYVHKAFTTLGMLGRIPGVRARGGSGVALPREYTESAAELLKMSGLRTPKVRRTKNATPKLTLWEDTVTNKLAGALLASGALDGSVSPSGASRDGSKDGNTPAISPRHGQTPEVRENSQLRLRRVHFGSQSDDTDTPVGQNPFDLKDAKVRESHESESAADTDADGFDMDADGFGLDMKLAPAPGRLTVYKVVAISQEMLEAEETEEERHRAIRAALDFDIENPDHSRKEVSLDPAASTESCCFFPGF